MFVKRIEIHGFKSFAEKTILDFKEKQKDIIPLPMKQQADIDKDADIVLGVNKANAIDIAKKYLAGIDKRRVISLFPDTLAGIYQ